MNIILSTKERHPVSQAEVCPSLDLADKRVLLVFGLAKSRGNDKVYSHQEDNLSESYLRIHSLSQYDYSENGEETPELVDDAVAFWERQGVRVAVIGLAKNIRTGKSREDYKLMLKELHAEVLG